MTPRPTEKQRQVLTILQEPGACIFIAKITRRPVLWVDSRGYISYLRQSTLHTLLAESWVELSPVGDPSIRLHFGGERIYKLTAKGREQCPSS